MSEEIKIEVGQRYEWGPRGSGLYLDIKDYSSTEVVYKPLQRYREECIPRESVVEFIKTDYWRLVSHSQSVSAVTVPASPPQSITALAIRDILPQALRGMPIIDAVKRLVQVYTDHPTNSDGATTVHELQALIDRMRKERIANVLPQQEELMCDNEWSEPSE